MSGTRWFQLVEIHWQSKSDAEYCAHRLTRRQIHKLEWSQNKRFVMILTHWRSQSSLSADNVLITLLCRCCSLANKRWRDTPSRKKNHPATEHTPVKFQEQTETSIFN